MTKFKFTANIEFNAEDLDHAFDLLAMHFERLYVGEDEPDEVWFIGEMNIEPIEEEDDSN
jgi:hypothetical protein